MGRPSGFVVTQVRVRVRASVRVTVTVTVIRVRVSRYQCCANRIVGASIRICSDSDPH